MPKAGMSLNCYSTLNALCSPPLTDISFSCGKFSELKAKTGCLINNVFFVY